MKKYLNEDSASNLDWSKTNRELAKKHKCSTRTIRSWRKRLRKPVVHEPPKSLVDKRRNWDWTKSLSWLAKRYRISRERVSQIRAQVFGGRVGKEGARLLAAGKNLAGT